MDIRGIEPMTSRMLEQSLLSRLQTLRAMRKKRGLYQLS